MKPIFCGSLVVIFCLVLLTSSVLAQPTRTKVILDTDIGDDIDDAWALAFILAHQNFDLLGVTITHGNTPARTPIATKMLHITGQDKIPVAVGRKTSDGYAYQYTWAENFTAKKPIKQSAADFIVEQVKRYPGEVVLLAVGPLQNVADALRKEPNLGKYLKRVVLMSGCVYGTASNPTKLIREWNVFQSTADSQLVYGAGLPLTIVPLDATTHVRLTEDERKQVRDYKSPLTYALESLYRLWLESPTSKMTLHDQLAVAEAASPSTFFGKKEIVPIVVDAEGYTRIDRERGKPVTVCLEPKRDEFMKYYIGELIHQRLGR
ncbi:MAG: nucleoside hydrolase [Acidobacteria bacterium]|nr:nucleoside hydrolase [Acidobacteriota bacterium]